MRNNLIGTALMVLVYWSSGVFALDEEEDLSGNPFRCTVSAKSKDSCVSLDHCVWCQGDDLPGICVSEKQERALINKIPYVKCFENRDTVKSPPRLRIGESMAAGAPYDPKCLTAPSFANPDQTPEEACNSTRDSKGDMCSWCDAAGVFSLCLSHQQATDASPYLQCDVGDVFSTV